MKYLCARIDNILINNQSITIMNCLVEASLCYFSNIVWWPFSKCIIFLYIHIIDWNQFLNDSINYRLTFYSPFQLLTALWTTRNVSLATLSLLKREYLMTTWGMCEKDVYVNRYTPLLAPILPLPLKYWNLFKKSPQLKCQICVCRSVTPPSPPPLLLPSPSP